MDKAVEFNQNIQDMAIKYAETITKVAFTYLKNISDAEDIMQEVYLTLLSKNVVFDSEEHFKAWLIRVTINKCKNQLKSAWFRSNNPIPEDLTYLPTEQYDILQAVLLLDKKYRIPIHLYYYESYSLKEIAEILKVNSATVGTWLSRGRSKLQKMLGDSFYEKYL